MAVYIKGTAGMGKDEISWRDCSYENPKITGRGRKFAGWNDNGQHKQMTYARWVWVKYKGAIPSKHYIHHIDGNPLNNDISNLQCVTFRSHGLLHRKMRREKIVATKVVAKVVAKEDEEFIKWLSR